jgi:hypothetical protein
MKRKPNSSGEGLKTFGGSKSSLSTSEEEDVSRKPTSSRYLSSRVARTISRSSRSVTSPRRSHPPQNSCCRAACSLVALPPDRSTPRTSLSIFRYLWISRIHFPTQHLFLPPHSPCYLRSHPHSATPASSRCDCLGDLPALSTACHSSSPSHLGILYFLCLYRCQMVDNSSPNGEDSGGDAKGGVVEREGDRGCVRGGKEEMINRVLRIAYDDACKNMTSRVAIGGQLSQDVNALHISQMEKGKDSRCS